MKPKGAPKSGGRQKGTPNKENKDLRKWMTAFIEKQTNQIEKDWKTLDPKDRVLLFEKLLKYSLPALSNVTMDMQLDKLTDEQVDELFEKMKNHVIP